MKLLGICACLFNFCWSVIIFSQGANDESLHFHFKSAEQVGNFASYSIRPLCVDMFQKCKFCFITEEGKDYKSRFSQSTARTSWFLKQKGVCLMNLFLERSVKCQVHYISRLDSQFVKLENRFSRLKNWFSNVSRIEMQVTVNLLLSGTVQWEELGFSYVWTGMLLNTP